MTGFAKKERTRREDWLDAGNALLRRGGEDELTIDRLTKRLARTKGAFYHHFENIDAFRRALLDAWEATHTLGPIAASEGESVRGRRTRLYAAVAKLDHRLELAIRSWATRSDAARKATDAIDERRIGYLATLWPGRRSRELAEIEYATFLGLFSRYTKGDFEEAMKPMATLVRALEGL